MFQLWQNPTWNKLIIYKITLVKTCKMKINWYPLYKYHVCSGAINDLPENSIHQVKLSAQREIHPIRDNHCTLMLLSNLAEPYWVSVSCNKKILGDVMCVTDERKVHKDITKNQATQITKIYYKACVIIKGKCHVFSWISKAEAKHVKGQIIPVFTNKKYYTLFDAVSVDFPPFFSRDYNYILSYRKYSETYIYDKKNIPNDNTYAIFVTEKRPTDMIKGDNLFKCENNSFISSVYLCDGHSDCPFNSSLDEADLNCNESTTKSNCNYFTNNKMLNCFFNNKAAAISLNALKYNIFSPHSAIQSKNWNYKGPYPTPQNCIAHGLLFCGKSSFICYNVSDICSYSLNELKILVPCQFGEHIQNCKLFECNMKFKCAGYYCIPWNYVCDGKWDCPGGLDEEYQCANDEQCINLFKCKGSHICVHVNDICDNFVDCPYGDDEFLCSLHTVKCPLSCSCYLFSIKCLHSYSTNLYSNLPYKFVFITSSSVYFTMKLLAFIPKSVALVLNHNKLKTLHKSLAPGHQTLFLNLAFNEIETIDESYLKFGFNLCMLNLNHNLIKILMKNTIVFLPRLRYLDLSFNHLSHLFLDKGEIKLLNILNNSLFDITPEIYENQFTSVIITNDYHICCVIPSDSICTVTVKWYRNCSTLLNSKFTRWFCFCVFLFNLITNIVSIKQKYEQWGTERRNDFFIVVIFGNISNITCALFIFVLWYTDIVMNHEYAIKEKIWRSSNACSFVFMVSLNFSISSPLIFGLLSLIRLMVVIHPLDSKLRLLKWSARITIIVFISSLILAFFIVVMMRLQYGDLPFRLCSPFVDPTGEYSVIHALLFGVILLQISVCLLNVISYLTIFKVLRKSKITGSYASKEQNIKSLWIQFLVILSSNSLSWIVSSSIFLTALLKGKYHIGIMIWNTIGNGSVSSLINPIVSILLEKRTA